MDGGAESCGFRPTIHYSAPQISLWIAGLRLQPRQTLRDSPRYVGFRCLPGNPQSVFDRFGVRAAVSDDG